MIYIPIFFFITVLLVSIIVWIVYKKIKRGLQASVQKGTEIANDQQQKWAEKAQRKKLPEIVNKGFDDFSKIKKIIGELPSQWSSSLDPIIHSAKEILDEIAFEFEYSSTHKVKHPLQDKKLNSIRPFFHHSLGALLQFVEKLQTDHKTMDDAEIEKARQNIIVFKSDLLNHQEILSKVRRFDFDVVMDVIKARLKR